MTSNVHVVTSRDVRDKSRVPAVRLLGFPGLDARREDWNVAMMTDLTHAVLCVKPGYSYVVHVLVGSNICSRRLQIESKLSNLVGLSE